jgi:hypothetical protein
MFGSELWGIFPIVLKLWLRCWHRQVWVLFGPVVALILVSMESFHDLVKLSQEFFSLPTVTGFVSLLTSDIVFFFFFIHSLDFFPFSNSETDTKVKHLI